MSECVLVKIYVAATAHVTMSKKKTSQLKNDDKQSQLYLEPQTSGKEGGHMSTCSMKNLPSISVQLTATSAMGILKHWAIYRSSTSKALRQRGTAAGQQLCYNPCLTAVYSAAASEF